MRRLRSVSAVGAVVALSLATSARAEGPDEASLRAADAEQMRIVVAGDAKAQQAFMHDNYMINGPRNVINRKPSLVRMLGEGAMSSEAFDGVVEAVQITDNVGIVMGREVVTPAPGSALGDIWGARQLQRRYTNVFIWQDGRWRFLARQATIPAEPPNARGARTPEPGAR